MDIKIEIAPVYEELIDIFFNKPQYSEFSLGSGRCTAKTGTCTRLTVFMVMNWGCVGWSKYNYTTIRDSCYQDLKNTIEEMGLEDRFIFMSSPLKIISKDSGYAIQFKGLYNDQKNKGIVPHKGKFAGWFIDECQEVPNESFIGELKATLTRNVTDNFKFFYLFNPPANDKHFLNTTYKTTIPDYRYYLKTYYYDLPKKWLTDKFIKDAEMLKETNYKLFRYRYLGDAVSPEDAIFENLKLSPISQESIDRWLYEDQNLYCGLDFGYKPDPNAANMMYYDWESRTLYIFKEFEQGQLNNIQISDGLANAGFLKEYKIVCDNVDKDIADLRSFGWDAVPAIKGPGSRDKGFKWLCGLSQIVIDPERCPRTANEFESYVYKANKEGNIVGLFPEGQEDHHIAAVRYAMEEVWRRKGV